MNTLIINSDLPRLGSQARRPTGGRKSSGAGDWAHVYSVCTRSNHSFLRRAHRLPRHPAIALGDDSEVEVSDIFSVHANLAVDCCVQTRYNRQLLSRSSENILPNSNPSPWVRRLAHSITGFHLSRHINTLRTHHLTARLPWEWLFSLENSSFVPSVSHSQC